MGNGKTMQVGIVNWRRSRTAENVLGWERWKQPDWFRENIITLSEAISKRNRLFSKWLSMWHHSMHGCRDRQRYVAQRRVVVCEVKGETGQEQVVPTEGKTDRISNASRFIRKRSVARTKRNPTGKSRPSTSKTNHDQGGGRSVMHGPRWNPVLARSLRGSSQHQKQLYWEYHPGSAQTWS